MKMKSPIQAEQYERVYPLLVARELIRRSEGKSDSFEYLTSWLHSSEEVHVPLSDQLRLLSVWNEQGLISAPELIEDKDGVVQVNDAHIPEQGGRVIQIAVLDGLRKMYQDFSFYDASIGSKELRLKEQIAELKKLLKEQSAKLHRKDIELRDDEIPPELNAFLATLFLEKEGKLNLNFMKPPALYAPDAKIILKVMLSKSLYVIRTSKFSYDLEAGVLTLTNGKSAEFGVDTKLGKLLCSMDESYLSLYDRAIVKAAGSASMKSPQEAASQLIHDIRKRLDIKEGDSNDIFASGNGWRFAD